MKLTIATGILVGQTLSVTSDESPGANSGVDFVVDSSTLKKKELLTTTKVMHHQERTGTKARADSSLFHRSGNKPLVNRSPPLPEKKKFLCDPSLQDADIGMLSCGLGYECIADEFSTLGGVCTPSTSRQLQENNNCVLCPFGFTLGKESYDIIIDDTESGYGGKTCESTIDPAYYSELFPDESSCNALASAVQAAGCCVPKCELCDIRSYMGQATSTVVVDGISLPGYDVVTCEILSAAGYNKGTIGLENCPASRQAAIDSGCCVAAQCLTCEPGSYIPPTENSTTCYGLTLSQLSYGVNNTFDEENCLANTQLAEDEGCCTPLPIYNECNICGDATFYPDNTIFRVGTCEYNQPFVSAEDCVTYSSLLVTSCCGPAAAPAEDTDAPAPTPASSAMWSTGPVVVSMMCLTTSMLTVGGWFLGLN